MKSTPSLARTMLAFSIGVLGVASGFVLLAAAAVMRAHTSDGVPASDIPWGAAVLLLLIAGSSPLSPLLDVQRFRSRQRVRASLLASQV